MQEACWPRWKQCNKEGDEGHRRWWSTPISNTNKPLPPSSAAPPRSWDCTAAWVSPAAGGHKGGETEVVLPENEIMTGRVTTEVPPLRDKIMSSVSHINQRLQFTTFSVNLFTLTFPELCSKKVSRHGDLYSGGQKICISGLLRSVFPVLSRCLTSLEVFRLADPLCMKYIWYRKDSLFQNKSWVETCQVPHQRKKHTDDRGSKQLWNVGQHLWYYTTQYHIRLPSPSSPLWEPEISLRICASCSLFNDAVFI
jgi:hypothetical protein